MRETNAGPMRSLMSALARAEVNEATYLRRALEIAEQDGLGIARSDVQRVEALWSTDDGDSTSLGFVLSLLDGRRAYLQYLFDFADDEEEVELRPIGQELYPAIVGGGGKWTDDVGELNQLLMS